MRYDALVLAGGRARRMSGLDKPGLEVGGASMLDRVLAACVGAERTVVVGPERPTARPVTWTREDPPGAGPVPALRAGLVEVHADRVVLLAADLPFLTTEAVHLLAAAAPAVLTDGERPQWLCGAWRTGDLRSAAESAGPRLGELLGLAGPRWIAWQGEGMPWADCDTPEALERARGLV